MERKFLRGKKKKKKTNAFLEFQNTFKKKPIISFLNFSLINIFLQ